MPDDAPRDRKRDFCLVLAMLLFFALAFAWLPLAAASFVVMSLRRSFGEGADMGEGVYFVLAALYAPALALLGFAHGKEWWRLRNALLLGGTGYAGLVFAALAAMLAFPSYPLGGPHEVIAAATAIPAIVLPTIAAYRARRFPMPSIMAVGTLGLGLLVGAACVFERRIEVSLPITADIVQRWHIADWQDFAEYYIRADDVDRDEAAEYAERLGLMRTPHAFTCRPEPYRGRTIEPWSPPTREMEVWELDERVAETDLNRYPDGMSGCVLMVGWARGSLYVCDVCAWGI